uniref:Uncharacterized protein n=1 Tax=Branchiostoma floridae TaxID=7739 RepID=C3YG65_BRAFL|eukprot:XP_002604860.1 hypothetical protein BRAFLDRAFT_70712 [Branchiostoma floridae]
MYECPQSSYSAIRSRILPWFGHWLDGTAFPLSRCYRDNSNRRNSVPRNGIEHVHQSGETTTQHSRHILLSWYEAEAKSRGNAGSCRCKNDLHKMLKRGKEKQDNNAILENILNRLDKIEEKISTTKETKPREETGTGQVEEIVKKTIAEHKTEERDRENREMNIIIHRVPEPTQTNAEERGIHDTRFAERLFAEPLELGKIDIRNTVRLGKKNESTPRPLKVVLQNKDDKKRIMIRLKKLKHADEMFRDISVCDDLNKEERELLKQKVQEAKDLEKNRETEGYWKYRVRGPPWNLQIRRIKA